MNNMVHITSIVMFYKEPSIKYIETHWYIHYITNTREITNLPGVFFTFFIIYFYAKTISKNRNDTRCEWEYNLDQPRSYLSQRISRVHHE